MNYPVFIFHELVLRFSYINRQVGRYISSTIEGGNILIKTTSGKIAIAQELLEKQYRNPSEISVDQLRELASGFQAE
ncbi:hypothetical protein [Pedobacter sp. SL55]|uniref:hypothetical protein n=1 Tax=Pedobacter sp. SL55 TaxID=2995161 RepID=UPI0022716E89|nr:hypothetical protein [Pedobacter sp. SL55]WAC40184.1 hypothetical protein OVA16_16645 [Pedobacter sp. SL55]